MGFRPPYLRGVG